MKPILYLISIIFLLSNCSHTGPKFEGDTEAQRLHHFFEWSFEQQLAQSPMLMAYRGVDKRQGEFDDFSEDFAQKRQQTVKQHLAILKNFDRSQLSVEDQLSYDFYAELAQDQIESFQWRHYSYPVNQMFGVQSTLPGFLINIHRIEKVQDAENYISRLKAFRKVFDQVTNNLMRSESQKVVPPLFVFDKVIKDSQNIISGQPFDNSPRFSPLYEDFQQKLTKLKLKKEAHTKYLKLASAALTDSVGPAYADLIDFLKSQKKRANTKAGAWKFPKGEEYYRFRLKNYTTVDLSPERIHQTGLAEVRRIHREMDKIRQKMKFKGDLQAFFRYMQSSQFHLPANSQGRARYLKMAKSYISGMEKKLDSFFRNKPKAGIVVKAVEPFREKSAGMAFYQTPSLDGKRPGTYYVNLSNMKALPIWSAEALAYHEGIPGHHMQLTLAQEKKNLPKFRTMAPITAYSEGWGLYSEAFPKEYGFYKDIKSDFGRLSMELMRSTRLVVDTGLHWKKWTREQAIAYLDKNLPGDHDDNVRQIERYIIMPGQATAYKIGQLKILELRERAKKELGPSFDIRDFHEVILSGGALPLNLLEKQVERYIQRQKS